MQISDYLWQRARPESNRSIRHRRRAHKNKKPNITRTVTYSDEPVKPLTVREPVSVRPSVISVPVPPVQITPMPKPTVRKQRKIRVRIDFHDADTGLRIASPKMISGHPGERLALNYPHLQDWVFARIVGFTPTFPKRRKTIVLYYVRVNGAPVIVYHRDQDGQLICPPEHLTGRLDGTYTAKCLDYFKEMVTTEAAVSGTFTKQVRVITFRYQIIPIQPIKLPNVAYIELLSNKDVYETPASALPLPVKLPRGTFWRVFAAVQTINNHQVWLSLGGAQWLTNTDTRAHQQNPFLP